MSHYDDCRERAELRERLVPRYATPTAALTDDKFGAGPWEAERRKREEFISGVEAAIKSTTTAYPDGNPKTAFGMAKPAMSNVPPSALIHLMRAFRDGKEKYGRANWREKGVTASVYYDAAMRHLLSYWDGEDNAEDSTVDHLGHAMACLAIIIDARECSMLTDDRPKAGRFAELVKKFTAPLKASA